MTKPQAPCAVCLGVGEHAPECEQPRQTLHEVLARARTLADGQLRERIRRYLEVPDVPIEQRGRLARGKFCVGCREKPRYPDHHCVEHSMYVPANGYEARTIDGSPEIWLSIWSSFFERMDRILKT